MLRGEASALAGELAQALRDGRPRRRRDRGRPRAGRSSCSTRRASARWPGAPGGCRAQASTLVGVPSLGREQRVQRLGLRWGQVAGELAGDVALGQHQGGGDQALDDGGAGHDEPPSAQLVHQRRGDRGGAGGGERHRQQPCQDLAAGRRRGRRSRTLAQRVELLVAGLEPGGVGGERVGVDADLVGDEAQRRSAGSPRPAAAAGRGSGARRAAGRSRAGCGRARRRPTTARSAWSSVQWRIRSASVGGQGEQALQLRLGERAASRHGRLSQLR